MLGISSFQGAARFDRSLSRLYGKGVFTTIAVRNGSCLFLWEKHWRRLTSNAASLDIDLSTFSEESVRNAVHDRINDERTIHGRVRISFTDESTSPIWSSDIIGRTALYVVVGDRRLTEPLHLTISPHLVNSTSPLAGIKSCNYLEPLMSLQEATRRGFNEAIRLNERGEITSACMANVFWLSGGRLYTPSLKTGCLPGTTREYLLENLECEEVERPIDELHGVEAIFLTSAGLGVVQAAVFENTSLRAVDHPMTRLLPF